MESETANDTVVTEVAGDSTSSITDANGNVWAIVGGQVTVNGVVDPTTANVIELAYVNGKIWQENSADLWWAKTVPSDTWSPEYGTKHIPVQGSAFTLAGYGSYNVGTLGAGEIRLNGGETLTAAGVSLSGGELDVNPVFSSIPLTLQGNSSLTHGAVLDLQEEGTADLPKDGLVNDGKMTVSASTVEIGTLSGNGSIVATGGSTLDIGSATTSGETIQLRDGNLVLGAPSVENPGMSFLAPITDFGKHSTITLDYTQATSEVFAKTSPTAGELFLYNGTTEMADLHISGQAHIYATEKSGGSVILTAEKSAHVLPILSTAP